VFDENPTHTTSSFTQPILSDVHFDHGNLRADIDKDDFANKLKLFQKADTRTIAMSVAELLHQEGHLAGC
jgi:hypothetical protein